MKLYILGTCSGTEPQPDRKHTSFVVEAGGGLYWFDAGEGCSYTAHTMGLDLLNVRSIFISHTHMDHVGGLGNLLWNIRKLSKVRKDLPKEKKIRLFIPCLATWEGFKQVLENTEGGFACDFEVEAEPIKGGTVFQNEDIKVTAFPNQHIKTEADSPPRSFSYVIESEGKTVVFSGDVRSIEELNEIVSAGCDALLLETGHHKVEDCCLWAKNKPIHKLLFVHHGREILADSEACLAVAQGILGQKTDICHDRQEIQL
ncbi:MAG: MBL fold metallo-hydrolase [Clostridia bacterium]|nr:MBL fold metallo-hydrolase [Clostridia bacterium]